jgi:hypothetical protein
VHTLAAALGFWFGNRQVQSGEMSPGGVVTVFFSVYVRGSMAVDCLARVR